MLNGHLEAARATADRLGGRAVGGRRLCAVGLSRLGRRLGRHLDVKKEEAARAVGILAEDDGGADGE